MKVEVDLTEYGVKAPKWYDPINPHVINASGGSGGSNDVELTLAEYEALSEEEKMNGTNYFITDIGNPKSLSKKTLLAQSAITANTNYNLTDSYKNYDYVIIKVTTPNPPYYIRAYKTIHIDENEFGGVIDFYQSSTWSGAFESHFSADTIFRIDGLSQNGSAYTDTSSSKVSIIGYRYERVIVPNQMVNYSTVEARIGTWIDGKPLYQRSFAFNYSDLNTSGTIKFTPAINSSMISDLKETVDIDGILITNNYGPIPIGCKGYAESNNTSIYIEVSKYYTRVGIISQSINLQDEFDKLYVTVRYTKTTD